MKSAVVFLVLFLVLTFSAVAAELPHSRDVADTHLTQLLLPAGAPATVIAPDSAAWLSTSDTRLSRSTEVALAIAGLRADTSIRDIYATKIQHANLNRPRAVRHVLHC